MGAGASFIPNNIDFNLKLGQILPQDLACPSGDAGCNLAQFFNKNFFDNSNPESQQAMKNFWASLGQSVGGGTGDDSIIAKLVEGLFKNTGKGLNEGLGNLGNDLNQGASKAWSNLNINKGSETFFGDIGKAINDGLKNLNLDEGAHEAGHQFRKGLDAATKEAGQGIREGVDNLSFGALDGMRDAQFKFFTENLPYILATSALLTATPLVVYYLYRKALHNIGKPALAIESRTVTFLTPTYEYLTGKVSGVFNSVFGREETKTKPIFNEKVSRRIAEITAAIKNIKKHDGYFQNMILYGPGGTGKTMVSKMIAHDSNINYVMMSGGDLAQYIKRGEHVTELNKLLDSIEKSSNPTILFIDEAEALARDRGNLSAELLELQNAFLNRTGTQSKKFMLILATNRLKDIDSAVLSRMDHKIFIGPPEIKERAQIVEMYAKQFFSPEEFKQFFSPESSSSIAEKTDGFTGRALFKLINAIFCKKTATGDNRLTTQIIYQTIDDFVEQEKEIADLREVV